MPASLPSVPQMKNRATNGHRIALRNLSTSGSPWPNACRSMSEARGRRTVMDTLRRWECIRTVDGLVEITDRGAALLEALS